MVGDLAFVLCPRGVTRDTEPGYRQRYRYRSNRALEEEINAGLDALRARFPEYLSEGPMLYTGLSLGASMGVSIARRQHTRFPWLLLIEGGTDWNERRARQYARDGGQRVLFVCGQSSCNRRARAAAELFEDEGCEARVIYVSDAGHDFNREMLQLTALELSWLLQGDERWFGVP